MSVARRVACPTCRREFAWTEAARWRPFCSERCRMIDLGAWLDGSHAIPGEPVPPPAAEPGSDEQPR